MRNPYARAAVVTAAAIPLLAVATPASGYASAGATVECGYRQMCASVAQSVPRVGTGTDVAVSCSAYTPYEVQATAVRCYILGNTGDVHWTAARYVQGQAATLEHTFSAGDLRSNVYQVCTGAGYIESNGPGNVYVPAHFVCERAV